MLKQGISRTNLSDYGTICERNLKKREYIETTQVNSMRLPQQSTVCFAKHRNSMKMKVSPGTVYRKGLVLRWAISRKISKNVAINGERNSARCSLTDTNMTDLNGEGKLWETGTSPGTNSTLLISIDCGSECCRDFMIHHGSLSTEQPFDNVISYWRTYYRP